MIFRVDVRPADERDPAGESVRRQVQEFGVTVGPIATSRIYLIDADANEQQVTRAAKELLADPIVERADVFVTPPQRDAQRSRIEIHPKPGVMDPVAQSTEMALRDMSLKVREVRTGRAYLIDGVVGREDLQRIATRVLANGVIESVHFEPYFPTAFATGHEQPFELRRVPLRKLSDDELKKLSRDGHLFLSLTEMKAVQSYFRRQERDPTDVELETIAQTWSEHCVHKTLKSAVEVYDESGKLLRRYGNLIKETIFDSTQQLKSDLCLSVFKDNAGVIAFDETDAVCFKVETHNHPSAIEPYGGSATGIGGVIRDILGTGLAAKPIANTDVFCVAHPEGSGFRVQGSGGASALNPEPRTLNPLPKNVIHPKRILQQVVAGVRDYGNRMGIPTVNGAVYFDDRYVGNPLVFCGCAGLIPRDKIEKSARPGDAIVLMGGRTGRDGIHGATFSSAELTDTHADEFSHAVQIGNAITEKKVTDVILQARDRNLFTAITDCGAGGLSSAVGEMGEKLGASVELDKVPLKYAGLRYDEIWISEAQERMVLSVPKDKVDELLKLSRGEDVETTVIGHFGTEDRGLILNYRGTEVGRLSMEFLHNGIPMPTRRATVSGAGDSPARPRLDPQARGQDARATLLELLAHPNIASKHWIIRQYDHEVQGGSVVKPLVGPHQRGPSDAAVVRPKLNGNKGIVLACGFTPQIEDPYDMAIASIDEAIRNAVAVGADPDKLAILDNFCWPSVDDDVTMGTLVRACEACRDAALAYRIPFISGKDSLHNQFTDSETGEVIRIPRTLLISAIGVIDDANKCITMDLKGGRDHMLALARPRGTSLPELARGHRGMAALIARGEVFSCHDVSDGGPLVAAAEMCIASGLGVSIDAARLGDRPFDEMLGSYLIEFDAQGQGAVEMVLHQYGMELTVLGPISPVPPALEVGRTLPNRSRSVDVYALIDDLTKAWRGTLDW